MQKLYQLTLMNNSDSQRLSLANDFEKPATLWRKFIYKILCKKFLSITYCNNAYKELLNIKV